MKKTKLHYVTLVNQYLTEAGLPEIHSATLDKILHDSMIVDYPPEDSVLQTVLLDAISYHYFEHEWPDESVGDLGEFWTRLRSAIEADFRFITSGQ